MHLPGALWKSRNESRSSSWVTFIPLASINAEENKWLAYQCDRPDLGEGMVMAFRRANAPWKPRLFVWKVLWPATPMALKTPTAAPSGRSRVEPWPRKAYRLKSPQHRVPA